MSGEPSYGDWLSLLPEAALVVSLGGRVLEVNDAFRALVAPRDPHGAALADLVAAENGQVSGRLRAWARSKQLTPGRLVLRSGENGNAEVAVQAGRLSPPGAEPVTLLVRCRPKAVAVERFHLLNAKIDALSAEVLARKAAEQDAEEQRERLRTTLLSIGDAVITTDAEGRMLFMNPPAERLTGWSLADAAGRESFEVFRIVNEDTRQTVQSPVDRVIREGVVVGLANHTILIARDGAERPIDDSGAPIRDGEGKLIGVVLVFRDISERRRREADLHRSHALLHAIVEGTTDAVFVKDLRGIYLTINSAGARILGRVPEEVIGRDDAAVLPPEAVRGVMAVDQRVIDTGATETLEEEIGLPGGRLTMLTTKAPYRDERGRIIGVVGIARDITLRKRAEQELRDSEQRLRFTLDAADIGTWEWDIETDVVRWSDNLERIHGLPPGSFGGTFDAFFREVHPEDRQFVLDRLRHSRETGDEYHVEYRQNATVEGVGWFEAKGRTVRDESGRAVRMVGICANITSRKRAEQELRESERRFRSMADSAPVFILMSDLTGGCTYFNRQWLEFTGRKLEQEVGNGWLRSVHADDRDRVFGAYLRAFEAREPFGIEFRLRRHDGEHRWVLGHGQPRYTPDGSFMGYIGSCVDITERQLAEQQLLSINETLERRVEQRTAQLRELAHQLTRVEQKERRRLAQTLHDHLQQLLVAARMRADMLIRRAEGADLAEAAQQVHELIGQSLEASRSLTVELSPPVLYDGGLCAALPWLSRQMEERHGLRVTVRADAEAEPRDEETRVLLFLVVRELLFNIVKHAGTDSAAVTLSLSEGGGIGLLVEDRGVGFAPSAAERERDGAGYGLFNVRERIEFLGGRMEIRGAPGEGTRVWVELPRGAAAADRPVGSREPRARGVPAAAAMDARGTVRVLLADDHTVVRQGIARVLAEQADLCIIAEAADGQEAVDLTRRHQPDVVVMDVTMPKLNGIQATRLIGEQSPGVAVVGLSMHDSRDMARAMLDAGAFRMLVKDGSADLLLSTIREAASARVRGG